MITEELSKLLIKQAAMAGDLSVQLIRMILGLWSPFRDWYDEDLVIARSARSATTVETALAQMRARQRAYMKFIYKEMDIDFPSNEQIEQKLEDLNIRIAGGVDIYPREGVSALDAWMRPAEQFRYHVSKGLRDNAALVKALDRASKMANTDLTLARRAEMGAIYQATPKVEGYRRVIHPELSEDGTSCGLCVVAAQRVYKKAQLLPIHMECNCSTLPITRDQDPGLEINQDDLQRIYDEAGGNGAGDLLKTKVHFGKHGELGEIIKSSTDSGYDSEQKANKKEMTPLENLRRQHAILKRSLERLEARKKNGEKDLDQSISWLRDRVSVLGRQVQAVERNQKR